LFTQFLGQLLGYFSRYIQKGDVDIVRDNVAFQIFPFYLNEAEISELGHSLNTALLPYAKNEPSPDRRRLIMGVISLPDAAGGRMQPNLADPPMEKE
jgi:hypothetical protein